MFSVLIACNKDETPPELHSNLLIGWNLHYSNGADSAIVFYNPDSTVRQVKQLNHTNGRYFMTDFIYSNGQLSKTENSSTSSNSITSWNEFIYGKGKLLEVGRYEIVQLDKLYYTRDSLVYNTVNQLTEIHEMIKSPTEEYKVWRICEWEGDNIKRMKTYSSTIYNDTVMTLVTDFYYDNKPNYLRKAMKSGYRQFAESYFRYEYVNANSILKIVTTGGGNINGVTFVRTINYSYHYNSNNQLDSIRAKAESNYTTGGSSYTVVFRYAQ